MKHIGFVALLLGVYSSACFAFNVDYNGDRLHNLGKRSITRQNLSDPSGCIQNCSINGSLPKELENANPVTLSCYLHKQRSECYERCPNSEAKLVILDNIRPFGALCSVPPDVLEEDAACVRNQSLSNLNHCDQNCPTAPPELLSPAVVVDPFFSHSIIVHFEKDRETVEQKLKDLCNFGKCQWSCKREIVEAACGQETANRIEISYRLPFETIPKLYIDLKVIDTVPEECRVYVIDSNQVKG